MEKLYILMLSIAVIFPTAIPILSEEDHANGEALRRDKRQLPIHRVLVANQRRVGRDIGSTDNSD